MASIIQCCHLLHVFALVFLRKCFTLCIPVNVEGRLIYPCTSKGLDRVYACGSELYLALKLGATIEIERGWVLNALTRTGKSHVP